MQTTSTNTGQADKNALQALMVNLGAEFGGSAKPGSKVRRGREKLVSIDGVDGNDDQQESELAGIIVAGSLDEVRGNGRDDSAELASIVTGRLAAMEKLLMPRGSKGTVSERIQRFVDGLRQDVKEKLNEALANENREGLEATSRTVEVKTLQEAFSAIRRGDMPKEAAPQPSAAVKGRRLHVDAPRAPAGYPLHDGTQLLN